MIAALRRRLGAASLPGEVHSGDDTAVLLPPASPLLFATDVAVERVHFDLAFSSPADAGWKVAVANLSDVAAMGGRPTHVVAGVAGRGTRLLEEVFEGLLEACRAYETALVGGDLSHSEQLFLSVAILGQAPPSGAVLRSGGRPGDELYCTGPLGAAAAGLSRLRQDGRATGRLVEAFLRPRARVREGSLAARLGASAMIDISDGLAQDLSHLTAASGVGAELEGVPVAEGASEQEALSGGEDYELLFSVAPGTDVEQAFAREALAPPVRIGRLVAEPARLSLRGEPLEPRGYSHGFG